MTVVGKILVFVNLVFSLVVGGLITMAYSTRTNWKTHADKVEAEFRAAIADRDQYAADLAKQKQTSDAALAKLTQERDTAVQTVRETERQLNAAKEEVANYKDTVKQGGTATVANQAAADARKAQVAALEKDIAAQREETKKVITQRNAERNERIRAEVEAKTLQARNNELENAVRDLAKDLARAKASPGSGTAPAGGTNTASTVVTPVRNRENPPRDNLEGRILSTDTTGELVRVSIGSDAGLEKGHTLKVFRLDKIPENSKYLGLIEILKVEPHQAVGRPIRRPLYPIKTGDRVASQIVAGR